MKTGDKVKVKSADGEFVGVYIDKKEETTVLKLENGYNIGIDNDKIEGIDVVSEGEEIKISYENAGERKEGLPLISILHTGGTIASKVDYRTGGVYSSFNPEDLLGLFPELGEIANFDSRLVSNMWSDDLRFANLSSLALAVEEEVKKGIDGVIIGMGTDNLAVAAAGLSFMLEEIGIPVVFVGSQRSSDRGSSDAAMNLVCAAQLITKSEFSGVCLCMHAATDDDRCVVLPAVKTKKMHSSRRDAFKAVNDDVIGFVKTDGTVELKGEFKLEKGKVLVKPDMEDKVGLLKIHVNMFPEEFLVYKGFKGLVIEGTGLGHAPTQAPNDDAKLNLENYKALKEVVDSGCVVVMTTNCIFGRVNMNVYDKGRDLLAVGVVSGEDMLAETALVKLSWLLGNYSVEESRRMIGEDLRGEINNCLGKEEFL